MHIPVLLKEVLKVLDPKPGEFFIDGTYGSGGHSEAIRELIAPSGRLLAIDWERTGENYADLPEILRGKNLGKADGLLLDLGFSSEQLEGGRGFSFQKDEPLVMTYHPSLKPVKELLEDLNEAELADIIYQYGEERASRKIAKAIKEAGARKRIETTGELASVIESVLPRRGKIHPATKTFMALRIYANHELENLERILKSLSQVLKTGGRAAIISFHSVEDRIVKNYFRDSAKAGQLKIITKKPITATSEEAKENPRSRSAKLRAAILI